MRIHRITCFDINLVSVNTAIIEQKIIAPLKFIAQKGLGLNIDPPRCVKGKIYRVYIVLKK